MPALFVSWLTMAVLMSAKHEPSSAAATTSPSRHPRDLGLSLARLRSLPRGRVAAAAGPSGGRDRVLAIRRPRRAVSPALQVVGNPSAP
jgi:hypothetical protein